MDDYWTIIENTGQIHDIPSDLNNALFDVQSIQTKRLYERGTVLLMIETGKGYQTFEFDHRGQICAHNPQIFSDKEKKEGEHVLADSKGNIYRFICSGTQEGDNAINIVRASLTEPNKENLKMLVNYNGGHAKQFIVLENYFCWLVVEDDQRKVYVKN